jgi:iron complex transport system substrate-binding protein
MKKLARILSVIQQAGVITGVMVLLLIPVTVGAQNDGQTKPQRIVSIGLCADQLLLQMAERWQISSLTNWAANPEMSYMVDTIGDIPLNSASVEEIIPYRPDLVVGSSFAAWDTSRFLRQLGYQVKLIEPPTSIDEIYAMLIEFGEWTGNQSVAREMIATMQRQILEIQLRYADRPEKTMIVYSPNGYTIGANTLENDVMKHAGFRNLAAEMGIVGFQKISLEKLAAAKPDFLQLDSRLTSSISLATAYTSHPVLDKIIDHKDPLFIPTRLRICAGPMITQAIEQMAAKR